MATSSDEFKFNEPKDRNNISAMTADQFRFLLRQRLGSSSDEVLLRVKPSSGKNEVVELTGAELVQRSAQLADSYCKAPQAGVVLILLPHSVELFLLYLGLVLNGRLPAILPWPTNRIDPEKYRRNIVHQLSNLPAAQLITVPSLGRALRPDLPFVVTTCPIAAGQDDFAILFSAKSESPLPDQAAPLLRADAPSDALFLQFSGGTTGEQKCIVVTATMLANQLDHLRSALQFSQRDGVVSWLPMYHDMGLIACFWLPLWSGACSTQFAAVDWLMHPGLLFDFLTQYDATFCWLPNFAFAYLAAQRERTKKETNLANVRAFINCSEPVRQRSIDAFVDAFGSQGVRREQVQASYAMAENVFAVTQSPIGELLRTVSRSSIRAGAFEPQLHSYNLQDGQYTSSGRPVSGTFVRIRDGAGDVCAEEAPGEIEIRSQSLFSGYWGVLGFQSQILSNDGWYATGDYGFIHAGNLFVVGRIKDIIMMGGVNVFPEDIEALISGVKGIYPGRVVAFGVDDQVQGTESLAIVAEMRGDFDPRDAADLEGQIRHQVTSVLGITARYVRVVPERWILKSTAGKISRRETRRRFLGETERGDISISSRVGA
jgi:fatty-acyl-CoA synthase